MIASEAEPLGGPLRTLGNVATVILCQLLLLQEKSLEGFRRQEKLSKFLMQLLATGMKLKGGK